MSESQKDSSGEVIRRMKEFLGVSSDTDLGKKLDIAKSTISNWVQRNTIPYEACAKMALYEGADLHWLLLGEESKTDVKEESEANSLVAVLHKEEDGYVSSLWRIIDLVMREGSATQDVMAAKLNETAENIEKYCIYLYRHRVLKRSAEGWVLTDDAVIRVVSDEDLTTLSKEALKFLWERVVPGTVARESSAILVMAEVKVIGEEPGERIMEALRNAIAQIDDPNGSPQKIVVGVAPG